MASKTKAKKQPKRDYLKITAFSLLAVVLIVTTFTWWNSGDYLNMISTSVTSLAFSILLVLSILASLFWLLILIDAWTQKAYVWFVFILFGSEFFALLYLLIRKPKFSIKTLRTLAWVGLVIYILVWTPLMYSSFNNRLHPFDESKLQPTGQRAEATIVTKDLKGFQYVGKTACGLFTDNGKYYIKFTGGRIVIPKNSTSYLNYSISAEPNDGSSGLGGGSQTFEGQPQDSIEIADLTGISYTNASGLKSCRIDLWSS